MRFVPNIALSKKSFAVLYMDNNLCDFCTIAPQPKTLSENHFYFFRHPLGFSVSSFDAENIGAVADYTISVSSRTAS